MQLEAVILKIITDRALCMTSFYFLKFSTILYKKSILMNLNFSHFRFILWTAERNSKKLDTQQNLNVLYKVCVLRADWINKMAALASDLMRHFQTTSL